MTRIRDWQKIQTAVSQGLVREQTQAAEIDQVLTFVLSDKKFFHHASLSSAKAEKEFLQTALDKQMRIYKVWNVSSAEMQADLTLIRGEATKLSRSSNFYQALDRVLESAGY